MNKEFKIASAFILVGFLYRLIPGVVPNFTPIGAMALVGGLYLNKRLLAFAIPVLALFASDLILNNTVYASSGGFSIFQDYMIWTYGAFLLTVILGFILAKSPTLSKMVVGALGASVLFFVISNFGTWLTSGMYPKNLAGLGACFSAAIPFFRNTLIGNILFVTAFVGGVEYVRYRSASRALASN